MGCFKKLLVFVIGSLLLSCRSRSIDFVSDGDAAGVPSATEIYVDTGTEFQTIEGFGGFNTIHLNPETWNLPLSEKYDVLAYDLGISMLRHEIDPRFWELEDRPFNVQAPVFGGESIAGNFRDAVELHHRGVDRFIASVWSPPAWMKTNQRTTNGGRLKKEYVGRFAEFIVGYVDAFRNATGLDLYAVSIQNEPDMSPTWNSCLYSFEEYADALQTVRAAFTSRGIRTKLFGPEMIASAAGCAKWIEDIIGYDPSSIHALDAFAFHIYFYQIVPPFFSASGWLPLEETCREHGMSLWQTETSYVYGRDWNGAMDLASAILCGLKYGKMSAWCWWALIDREEAAQYALIVDGKRENRYYASRHFYQYLRPGAVQMQTDVEDDEILAAAFHHKPRNIVTVIMINKSEKGKTVKIKMRGLPVECQAVTSTEFEKSARTLVHSDWTVDLKPRSITTLVCGKSFF